MDIRLGNGFDVHAFEDGTHVTLCGVEIPHDKTLVGHSDADVKKAIVDQLDRIPFAHTAFYTSDAAETLADRLTAMAPGNLDRVYFVSGSPFSK